MPRRTQILSIFLLFCVFVMPYATLAQTQTIIKQSIIPISPIPHESSIIPELTTFERPPSAFATITLSINGAISSGYTYEGEEVSGEWDDAMKIDFKLTYQNKKSGDGMWM